MYRGKRVGVLPPASDCGSSAQGQGGSRLGRPEGRSAIHHREDVGSDTVYRRNDTIEHLYRFTDVRGKGLLYKISMEGSTTDGRIKLKMSRASQLSEVINWLGSDLYIPTDKMRSQAYEVFRRTLRDHLNSSFSVESVWDESALVSAKGREIFDLAEKEETVEGLVKMAAKSFLLGDTDAKHNRYVN